ncbi:hypothetical protein [Allocoleopsis sp.]|uniref:hypothetical protein n=1 Tax=Allocoleopsis sp. TaxID=3088169 RepID=UPI002FD431A8
MNDEGRERVMESLDFRGVPNPVANPATQSNEIAVLSQVTGAIASHKAEGNPHTQYALASSLGTASTKAIGDFDAAGAATNAITTHKAETNPHSQYALTASLGTASTKAITDFDAAGAASSAITSHESSTNHPLATPLAPGLMSATDKNKLNSLSTDVLSKSGNLTDVPDKVAARTNLGLGSAAIANSNSFEPAGAVNTHAAKYSNGFHIPTTGITDTEVASNAAISESKLGFTIPAWTPVTYASNWGTLTGGEAVAYRKFADKLVQLSGTAVKAIALVNSDLICTLPTGFRPDRLARFAIYGSSATGTLVSAFLTISTIGEVRLLLGATNPTQYIAIPNNTVFFAA